MKLFLTGRAHDALVSMGCAVFHGGFSTFAAFVLTCTSDSYVFNTFFKACSKRYKYGLILFSPTHSSVCN